MPPIAPSGSSSGAVSDIDRAAADHLLTTTRAVRRRLDLTRPVEPELITECVRVAVQAPTGSNSQGWRWLVVTDEGTRAALADLYREGGGDYLKAAAAGLEEGDSQTRRVYESAQYLLEHLAEVPVHVIPCILGRLPDGAPNVFAAGLYGSIFPAIWNFQLALRARGVGTCLTTLHLFREPEAAELLGIPDTVTQVGLLPVAYYTGDTFKPAERRPVEEITYWNRWKETRP